MKRILFWCLIVSLLAVLPMGSSAAQSQEAMVYAVLFYSPHCGACHYVITTVLPPIQAQYDEQLQMLFVNVTTPLGQDLFRATQDTYNVPDAVWGYVPTLVIGDTVLVGGQDIPVQMPLLIEAGLAAGGLDVPAIPGLRERYRAAVEDSNGATGADVNSEGLNSEGLSTVYQEPTWRERFEQDLTGNALALGVLGILFLGLTLHLVKSRDLWRGSAWLAPERSHQDWLLLVALALMSAFIAATLLIEARLVSVPTLLASVIVLGLGAVLFMLWQARAQPAKLPASVLPVVALLGLVVASYLAYVEVTQKEAACGTVGNCNTVQQSDYAELFGLLPIGVLGVLGYVFILGAWLCSRQSRALYAELGQGAALVLTLLGTLFSIYLTFLEPFVIGATCAWCLTSAMLMMLLLSLQMPDGWAAFARLLRRPALH